MPISINRSKIIQTYQQAIDEMINKFGKTITLYFKDTLTNVNTTFADVVRPHDLRRPDHKGQISTPAPTESHNTTTILALVKFEPSDYEDLVPTIGKPLEIMRLKTFLSSVPDLIRADFVIPDPLIEGIYNQKYKLAGQPTPRGLGENRYAISFWKAI